MRHIQLEKTTPAFFHEKSWEEAMGERRLVKLMRNYYFDRVSKVIIKRAGSDFGFVTDNRRSSQRPVTRERRESTEPVEVRPKPIAQGLYWDAEGKKVYKKVRGNFILYSRDRRQEPQD